MAQFRHLVEDTKETFRHCVEVLVEGRSVARSAWASYTGVACLRYEGEELRAVTDYYDGTFVPWTVFVVEARSGSRPDPMVNITEHDAHDRILDAKTGSMADATDEYLLALSRELRRWDQQVHNELQARCARAQDPA